MLLVTSSVTEPFIDRHGVRLNDAQVAITVITQVGLKSRGPDIKGCGPNARRDQ